MRFTSGACLASAFLLFTSSASAQSAVVRDANGTLVGVYVGVSFTGADTGEGWAVLTPFGYAAVLDEVTGGFGSAPYAGHTNRALNNVRFALPDCQGEARVQVEVSSASPPIVGGFVFRNFGTAWYSPKDEVSALTGYASTIDDNGMCSNGAGSARSIRVLPNDADVTGMPSTGYVGPLRLGFVTDAMFADSFEEVV